MIYQQPLPVPYPTLSPEECTSRIQAVRQALGSTLVVVAHHYQRPEIVALSDIRGDSLLLAQFAARQREAQFIVFCGVHFMAESTDILKPGDQTVILPDLGAGCDMADMADASDVAAAWDEMVTALGHEDVIPVTYINSTAALKAFVATKGGVVCTSSNAQKVLRWALDRGQKVFFFPDQHLGRNTAKAMGFDPKMDMALWDPKKNLGGITPDHLKKIHILLWAGHCPVHQMFSLRQAQKLRDERPEMRLIVHPECPMEVVDLADDVGSTEFIVKTIAASPAGSQWAVGTEMNLVNRIAQENPDKTVVSLNPYMCLCGTMNRIDLSHLAWTLESLAAGHPQNVIVVREPVRSLAKQALDRMLELSV